MILVNLSIRYDDNVMLQPQFVASGDSVTYEMTGYRLLPFEPCSGVICSGGLFSPRCGLLARLEE